MSSLAVAKSPGLLGLQEAARMPCCDRAGDLFMYNSMVAGRILAVRGIMSSKPEERRVEVLACASSDQCPTNDEVSSKGYSLNMVGAGRVALFVLS